MHNPFNTSLSNIKTTLLAVSLLLIATDILSQNAPFNLRSCDKENPVGTDNNPYFGWNMDDPDDNEVQSAFQIMVASNLDLLNNDTPDMWNSGQESSDMQNYVYYNGDLLAAGKKYYWKVKIWDKDGNESPFSNTSTFETGLFTNEDWNGAKWIKRANSDNEDFTYYRKPFQLADSTIERAIVYVTAVHDFELFLNGNLVGKGPTYHYPQYQYYNAYDITPYIQKGSENLFACFTHWYGGGQGRPTSERGFLLKAVIEYSNSATMVIGTDSTWKQIQVPAWRTGQSKRNGEGIGFIERIDAREFISDWNKASYYDSNWSNSDEMGPHPTEPWTGTLQPNLTRLIENEIVPKSITKLENERYIIDLGKVYAGMPRITFIGGDEGKTVTIKGGYTLGANGYISTATNQSTDMSYIFTLNGDTAIFQPKIYLGMRYIYVSYSPTELTKDNVKFINRHYELDENRSAFTSSNGMLNAVWNMMKHSLLLGSQESFVDTPTREKGGFLGDSWSIGVAAMSTMADRTMNKRILLEFLDSQDQYWPDGRLNAVYPNVDGKRDIPDYTQMYLVWVWDYYLHTGDKSFLRNNFSKLKKVADYVDNYTNESTGLIHRLAGGGGAYLYGIIDWPEQMRYGYDASVVSRTIQNAYAYADFENIAKIAQEIDSTDDYGIYHQKALDMKTAINANLIDANGLYVDGLKSDLSQSSHISQQANMFPMAMGLVPDENRDTVAGFIRYKKMSSGMVTLRWLPESIGQADEGRHLVRLYTNSKWDGWAKTISLGGTATWESWDALTNGQSMSHPWGASGLLGIQQYILGIKALKPQHEMVQIKPIDCKQELDYAFGILPTDRGDIKMDWERNDTLFTMEYTIPDNITARVYVPMSETTGDSVKLNGKTVHGTIDGNYIYIGEMGSGSYEIERTANKYIAPPEPEPEPEAIINTSNNNSFLVYPNPANHKVLIDLEKEYTSANLRINNLMGETLKNISLKNTSKTVVNISELENGIYFLTVITPEKEHSTIKLVKK